MQDWYCGWGGVTLVHGFPCDWHSGVASTSVCVDLPGKLRQPCVSKWWLGLQTLLNLYSWHAKGTGEKCMAMMLSSPYSGLSHPLLSVHNLERNPNRGTFKAALIKAALRRKVWSHLHTPKRSSSQTNELESRKRSVNGCSLDNWYFQNTYRSLPDVEIEQDDKFEDMWKKWELRSWMLFLQYCLLLLNTWWWFKLAIQQKL